jgi:hypothetical protein
MSELVEELFEVGGGHGVILLGLFENIHTCRLCWRLLT